MIALIMAGGSGTRFWPRSREEEPKQFLHLLGGRSLLSETVERIRPLVPPERILVVTASPFVKRVIEEIPGIPPENVLGEPIGRNTAPCVALAAARAERQWGGEEVMVVLPADHHIGAPDRFLETLRIGGELCAAENILLTLGVVPTSPETGYGYLERGPLWKRHGETEAYRVDRFVEKPDLESANRFLQSGKYYWNSGMFLWRVRVITEELIRHMPELKNPIDAYREAEYRDLEDVVLETYKGLSSISIDCGVMEKADCVVTLPADFPWSDVGSWSALGELIGKNREGNAVVGEHVAIDSKGCIVYSPGRLTATIGVNDLIIVETDHAVLVCPRDRAQDVKKMVEKLRDEGREELL